MSANPARTGSIRNRFAAVVVALTLFAAFAPAASADIKSQLDAAKARLAEIKREVAAQNVKLAELETQAAKLATKVGDAQAAFDAITAALSQTKHDLAVARQRYQALRDQLDARARETYMNGPGSDIEFILGATSLTDLSDRLEYVNALTQSDSDLATQVQNLRNDLAAKAAKQASLQADRASKLSALQGAQAALDASLAQQQQILDDIQAKQAEAEKLVSKLGKEYKDYLSSLFGVKFYNGTFKTCPVGDPHGVGNDFGAPRYAGGYHPHAGNDIFAPLNTPIRAPFDGTAHSSYNTLGGNSEFVYGADGYVYNAHLDHYSDLSNGPVHAGDVIGFVGNTGDAQGGATHDHFEWHPKVMPTNWPVSPYGVAVLSTGAVNPNPLLTQVC